MCGGDELTPLVVDGATLAVVLDVDAEVRLVLADLFRKARVLGGAGEGATGGRLQERLEEGVERLAIAAQEHLQGTQAVVVVLQALEVGRLGLEASQGAETSRGAVDTALEDVFDGL